MSENPELTLDDSDLPDGDEHEKVDADRRTLLYSVSAGKLDTVQERVAWILNHNSDARDSDIALQIEYWEMFEPELAGGEYILKNDLYRLPRLGSLTRARAKIQNTYNLFKASPEVRKHRGTLSEEEITKAQEQRPGHPKFSVFADESGKTSGTLLVGSLWFLHYPDLIRFITELEIFKSSIDFKREFHFKEVNARNLNAYIQLSEWLKQKAAVVSFKAVSVAHAGLKDVRVALETLFYHLLVRGVEHEHSTGRAPLPRSIDLWKDQEEVGSDKLFLAELGDRLRNASASRFEGNLEIGELEAFDSKDHALLQVADLYTGCLNRVLNTEGSGDHPKDVLAKHFLTLLGLPKGPQIQESEGGLALHVSL